MMCNDLTLDIPGSCQCLHPGDKIKLGRFDSVVLVVNYGWFEFDGNRPFCGWFLTNFETGKVKPLLKTDLYDCYMIE